jgi:NAD-dependent deacetylase
MNAELEKYIERAKNIVFFGGAGVSTESGIPDFRSRDGLYNQQYRYDPEEILSHHFFLRETEEFYRFYRDKIIHEDARPNPAHIALAHMESEGRLSAVITQNIDGLHTAAGSKNVFELHGSILRNHCMKCGKFHTLKSITGCTGMPKCSCGGIIKPDVVLYEEPLDSATVSGATEAIEAADLLIIGGTSLNVYPAAGLIRYFHGRDIVVINKSATIADRDASLTIAEPIGKVLEGF